MRTPPMSIPPWAWALRDSTITGSRKRRKAAVAKAPPALGWGKTATSSRPKARAVSRSTTRARFRCSQAWTATWTPLSRRGGRRPSRTAWAASRLGLVPTLSPRTSLVEPPRTKRLPGAMGKA